MTHTAEEERAKIVAFLRKSAGGTRWRGGFWVRIVGLIAPIIVAQIIKEILATRIERGVHLTNTEGK